ncbi:MAG TPA: hypothetical protein VN765_01985, partial [Candidatus Acidoferrum sp.]|nr:hypothetical protein [Candidatus Acidoferrum sp.]
MKPKSILSHRAAKKLAAMSDLDLGRLLRRSRLFRQGNKGAQSRHHRWWSAAEEQLLTRWPDTKVAEFLGRSTEAVKQHRLSLG